MALMRLVDLRPREIAASVVWELAERFEHAAEALGAQIAPLPGSHTPLFRRTLALAEYAITGTRLPPGATAAELVSWLRVLLGIGTLVREPTTPLELMLIGALARERYEAGETLSAAELALLSGYDRDHIIAIAESIPGAHRDAHGRNRPWRFRVSAGLHSWLNARPRSVA